MKCWQISDRETEAGPGFNNTVCLLLFSLDAFSQQLKEGFSVSLKFKKKKTREKRIHQCEHRLKHHHTVWFCCDGLICCLFTGHTGLLWQADRGIDPWAGLKPETGSDLSSTPSVLTMANGLRRLLSEVSGQEKKTFTFSWLKSRMQTESPLPVSQGQNAKSLQELKKKHVVRDQKFVADKYRAHGFISVQTCVNFHPTLHRRSSASNEWISTSLQRLEKRLVAKSSCLLSLTAF